MGQFNIKTLEKSNFISEKFLFKGMGLIYLMAFISLWVQIDGLYGPGGILPFDWIKKNLSELSEHSRWEYPSLLWWLNNHLSIHLLCGLGVLASFMMILGVLPKVSASISWIVYLSFVSMGQVFMRYQWDILLLEAGFITLFHHPKTSYHIIIWPYRWLLFRLMFSSGLVKVVSGDPAWASLEALGYHYFTQPLPNFISWIAFHLPAWFHQISTVVMFIVELIVPFFIFFPRRFRLSGFYTFLFFQFFIVATGNYGFFNWLAIILCLSLVDDRHWSWLFNTKKNKPNPPLKKYQMIPSYCLLCFVIVMGGLNLLRIFGAPSLSWMSPVEKINRNFYLVNSYGLFSVMTTKRFEIRLQFSNDLNEWEDMDFKYKPDREKKRPPFLLFHMPRLDWQMWFAALTPHPPRWFQRFVYRLLNKDYAVLKLMGHDSFVDRPPKYIRAVLFDYRFSTVDEFFDEGKWWKQTYKGDYLFPTSK